MSNISNHDVHNFRDYMNGACSFDVPSLDDVIDYIRGRLEPEQVYRQTELENWAINNGFVSEADAEFEAGSIKERCGELEKQRDELLAVLVKALPAIEEIRLVDLGALRDAENLGIASKIQRARRELAERVEIINTINTAIASAKGGAA